MDRLGAAPEAGWHPECRASLVVEPGQGPGQQPAYRPLLKLPGQELELGAYRSPAAAAVAHDAAKLRAAADRGLQPAALRLNRPLAVRRAGARG